MENMEMEGNMRKEENSQKKGIEDTALQAECALAEMFAWHGRRIKELEAENARYADVKAKEVELKKKQKELHERELELERMERDMRRHPGKYIFGAAATFLWEVSYRVVGPPPEAKCAECDENGYRHYTSPNGVRVKELCHCRWDRREYFACEARLFEIHLQDDKEPILFYRPEDDDRSFSTIMLNHDHRIYDGVQDFSELDPFRLLFRDETTARKYAEWLNQHEKPHYYNRDIRYEED